MKSGKTLTELAEKIEANERSKRDFVADTSLLRMVKKDTVGAEASEIKTHHEIEIDGNGSLPVNPIAHGQIGDRVGIPRRYYERMRQDAPELLADNVNHWFTNQPEKRMVRSLDGRCRAFLSDRYKPMDNFSVMSAALPVLLNDVAGLEVKSCELTESRMYIQCVTPAIQGEIKVGEAVQAGIIISNSEVGLGRVSVESLMFFLACTNGMIRGHSMKKHHVGKRIDTGADLAIDYFQQDTLEADNKAFMLMVRDTVKNAFDEKVFRADIETLRATTQRMIAAEAVVPTVENVTKRFSFSQAENDGVLTRLIEGADLSQFGLSAAVTNLANTVENYDRAVELERIGGQIVDLTPAEFTVISRAA